MVDSNDAIEIFCVLKRLHIRSQSWASQPPQNNPLPKAKARRNRKKGKKRTKIPDFPKAFFPIAQPEKQNNILQTKTGNLKFFLPQNPWKMINNNIPARPNWSF